MELGLIAPIPEQIRLHELETAEVGLVHLQAFERGDFVELEQHVPLERVLHPALDERDRDQPLALGHRLDLVQRVGRIDDRLAGLQLEAHAPV